MLDKRPKRLSPFGTRTQPCGPQHKPDGLLHQSGLELIVKNFEMGGHIGLKRELMQQPFGKGMDGLDFQPARRFQCPGKEPPRPRQIVPRRVSPLKA